MPTALAQWPNSWHSLAVQTVDLPLVGGVDQSTNAKLLASTRLLQAENLRVVDRRALRKRRGTTVLAGSPVDNGSPTPVGPVRLVNHAGQIVAVSEESLWTVGADGDRLEELDMLPVTTLQGVATLGHYGAANVVACACAETDAFRVATWSTFDGTDYRLHVQTTDLIRGAGTAATEVPLLVNSQGLKCLKAIRVADKIVVFWGESTNVIRYLNITSATHGPFPDTDNGTTLVSDASSAAPQWFDVCPYGDSGYAIVYRSQTAGFYTVRRYNQGHVSQASQSFSPGDLGSSPRFGIVAGAAGERLTVVYANTDASPTYAAIIRWYTSSIVADGTRAMTPGVLGVSVVRSIAVAKYEGGDPGDIHLAVDGISGGTQRVARCWSLDYSDDNNDTATQRLWDATISSKPWTHRGDAFFLLRFRVSAPNSYVAVVRQTPHLSSRPSNIAILEARVRGGQAIDLELDDSASSVIYTNGQVYTCLTSNDRPSAPANLFDPTGQDTVDENAVGAVGNQTLTVVGVDLFHWEQSGRARWQTATVGQYTCFAGGVLTAFDGRRALEIGWSSWPDITSANITASNSTGSVAEGTYQYAVCWEQMDWYGNRSQSAVKVVRDEVMAGPSDTFTIQNVQRLSLTGRSWKLEGDDARQMVMALYRSIAGSLLVNRLEGPGAALFPVNEVIGTSGVIPTYVDGNSDAALTLESRELVYIKNFGAGELQNEMPPPSNIICGHESRLFFVRADYPNVVGYTKQQFPGSALAWNASLSVTFDEEIYALASQDGNLIAFAAKNIYTVAGRPADNTGRSTGYDPPILLSGHLGTTDRRSVVTSPIGTWFRSPRGLEVLPRGGGAPSWVGERIRETLETYPVITAALHNAYASEVLFSLVTSEAVDATGVVIVYDYDSDVWFTRNYQDKPISDMCLDGENVVFGVYDSDEALTLWVEDDGFDDADGSFVGTVVETGDLRFANASGLHSLWRATLLGECAGVVSFTISDAADGDSYHNVAYRTATRGEFEIQHEVLQRKAKKHRLKFTEGSAGTADVEGVAYMMCTLEMAAMGGSARLPRSLRG